MRVVYVVCVVCVHSLVWDKVILTIINIYVYYYYYYYETGRFVQLSRMNNSGGIQLTVALQMPSTACDDGDTSSQSSWTQS